MIRTKSKPDSLSTLIKKADDVVSLFVRLNAADDNGTVSCISCGCRLWYLDADCCHFISRQNMATRFLLLNLAPGCQECNRYNPVFHLNTWEAKLGDTAHELRVYGKSLMKWTRVDLTGLIEEYSNKVKQLKQQKHL